MSNGNGGSTYTTSVPTMLNEAIDFIMLTAKPFSLIFTNDCRIAKININYLLVARQNYSY